MLETTVQSRDIATFRSGELSAPMAQNLPAALDRIEGQIALASNPAEINGVLALMDAAVAYAKRFYKDRQDVIQRAKSLRLQTERRLGEMLRDMPKQSGARGSAGPGRGNGVPIENPVYQVGPTLAEIGIDKKVSMRAQRLAALPPEKFEQVSAGAISVAQATATPAEQKAMRKPGKPKTGARVDAVRAELKAADERGASMLSSYARLILSAIAEKSYFSPEERDLLSQVANAITQQLH